MKGPKPSETEETEEKPPAIPRIIAYSDSESDDEHQPPFSNNQNTDPETCTENNSDAHATDALAVLQGVAASLAATDLVAVRETDRQTDRHHHHDHNNAQHHKTISYIQ